MTATEQRKVTVTENEYHDAKFNGYTVRVSLYYNPNQLSSMTLSRDEAEKLADLLDHYLTENPA